jgi:hypothetical protein
VRNDWIESSEVHKALIECIDLYTTFSFALDFAMLLRVEGGFAPNKNNI